MTLWLRARLWYLLIQVCLHASSFAPQMQLQFHPTKHLVLNCIYDIFVVKFHFSISIDAKNGVRQDGKIK